MFDLKHPIVAVERARRAIYDLQWKSAESEYDTDFEKNSRLLRPPEAIALGLKKRAQLMSGE